MDTELLKSIFFGPLFLSSYAEQPNIVFIFADGWGYGDLGAKARDGQLVRRFNSLPERRLTCAINPYETWSKPEKAKEWRTKLVQVEDFEE